MCSKCTNFSNRNGQKKMNDAEIKLRVLEATLSSNTIAGVKNPIDAAQTNLDWVLTPIDKPKAAVKPAKSQPAKRASKKSG